MAMPVTRYMVKRRRPGNSGLKIAAATDYTGITAQDSFASVLANKAPLVQEKLVEVRLCQDSKFEEHGCIKVTGDERLGRLLLGRLAREDRRAQVHEDAAAVAARDAHLVRQVRHLQVRRRGREVRHLQRRRRGRHRGASPADRA